MTDNIILTLPFLCFHLSETLRDVVERFDARYGVLPDAVYCPPGAMTQADHETARALEILCRVARETPAAKGMWYVGPIPEEVNDDKAKTDST